MDRLVYISSVGLRNIEVAQTARANNLANVSTPGFRADLANVMASEVTGDGYRSRVYGVNDRGGVDMSHGSLQETGRNLDVAISGNGLFSVMLQDGREAHTRNGSFQIDATGRLLTQQGHQVMGQAGPIALPPFETILFGADGSISIRPQGQGPDALAQVDRLKLVNPEAEQVKKDATGLLVPTGDAPFEVDETVLVNSGFIESSNVNAMHELTEIISLSRQFELEVKMMQNAKQNDEAASQLLRIG